MPAAVIRRYAPSLITSMGVCRGYGGGCTRDERAVLGRGPACGQDLASGPAEGNAQGKLGRLGRVGDPGCDLFRHYHLAGTCAALGAQVGVGVSGQGVGGDVIKRTRADGARFEQRGLDPQRARLDDEGLN
jgi:hypothetical protein